MSKLFLSFFRKIKFIDNTPFKTPSIMRSGDGRTWAGALISCSKVIFDIGFAERSLR